MKKHLVPLLLAQLGVFALPLSCAAKGETIPKARLLSTKALDEEDVFDFPPLPTPQTDVWDVSDVDISDVDSSRNLIAFTFDDAPASTLENILAVFAAFNESNPDCKASATLFCNGLRMEESALPNLSAAVTLGWELGNHTYSHPDITTITPTQLTSEIAQTDELLRAIDGKKAHLFRAPFGSISDAQKRNLQTPVIDWTIDTLDWDGRSEKEIYDTIFLQKFSGAIALMHDGYANTVAALKRLLPDLKESGYQVVSVSKMAKAHACALKNGSVYIRARKRGND